MWFDSIFRHSVAVVFWQLFGDCIGEEGVGWNVLEACTHAIAVINHCFLCHRLVGASESVEFVLQHCQVLYMSLLQTVWCIPPLMS